YSGDTLHTPSTSPAYALSVLRPTTTSISCTSTTLTVGSTTTCTVTVTDNGSNHVTPTGTVSWSVSPSGSGSFSSAATCTLSGGNGASSSCSITYTPTAIGNQTITADYAGDPGHVPASGTIAITSTPLLSVVASTSTTTAGNAFSVTVTAVDQFG